MHNLPTPEQIDAAMEQLRREIAAEDEALANERRHDEELERNWRNSYEDSRDDTDEVTS